MYAWDRRFCYEQIHEMKFEAREHSGKRLAVGSQRDPIHQLMKSGQRWHWFAGDFRSIIVTTQSNSFSRKGLCNEFFCIRFAEDSPLQLEAAARLRGQKEFVLGFDKAEVTFGIHV